MYRFMVWFFRVFILLRGYSVQGLCHCYNHGIFHAETRNDWGDGRWNTYLAIIVFIRGKRIVPWQHSSVWPIV